MGIKVLDDNWLKADWPVASNIYAGTTLRTGGLSMAPYTSWNMGLHTGDDPQHVLQNRQKLCLPAEPYWLEQVHGTQLVEAKQNSKMPEQADGAYSRSKNTICAVMTADCLPVLFCDAKGQQVAAVHAGWRGLAAGILDNTVCQFSDPAETLLVWLGPAISQSAYEVGDEVRAAFTSRNTESKTAFKAGKKNHWWMDLYALARLNLARLGVEQVYGGDVCTYNDVEKFFSYRRDGETGRMLSVIWIGD